MTPTSAVGLLRRSMRRHRARLAGSYALLTVWQLCETFVPIMIGVIIDDAIAGSSWSRLVLWLAVLAALFATLSYSFRFGSRMGFGAVQQEMHELRVEVATHALHPRGVDTTLLPGETLSLATSDASQVALMLRAIAFSIAGVSSLLVAAYVLLRIDLELGMVVLIGVPVLLLLIQVITPAIARRSGTQQETVAAATGLATDLVSGLRVLKGIGAEDVAAGRYRERSQTAVKASIRSADSYGLMIGLTQALSGLFLAVVALLAGRLALRGEISIGELVAVVGLSQFLAEPLQILGNISAFTAQAAASAKRIVNFLHTTPLGRSGSEELSSDLPELSLHGVHHGPLKGLTLTTAPGELVGVVMVDPAEAAALVNLLSGEQIAEEGSVRLSGVELTELTTDARRSCLRVNPHHVDLFEGTMRSNIDPAGRHDLARLDAVLAGTAADDVAELDDKGVDQAVTPQGATYSGGQRQRIGLARAIAVEAPILVLHDPTTAVDAVTEHRIAEGIRSLRHSQAETGNAAGNVTGTTLVVTSSPALLAQADRVLMVRQGRVRFEGTHHELMALDPYREVVMR